MTRRILPLLTFFALHSGLNAAVSLDPLFGDHAVILAGTDVPVWGSADEGEKVTVRLAGAEATLRETCGLLIESPVRSAPGPQFLEIYEYLAARDFSLFDIVRMSHRGSDSTLYQFYAVFIANRFDFRGKNPLRSKAQQAEVFEAVSGRREQLRAENVQLISSIKLKRAMNA